MLRLYQLLSYIFRAQAGTGPTFETVVLRRSSRLCSRSKLHTAFVPHDLVWADTIRCRGCRISNRLCESEDFAKHCVQLHCSSSRTEGAITTPSLQWSWGQGQQCRLGRFKGLLVRSVTELVIAVVFSLINNVHIADPISTYTKLQEMLYIESHQLPLPLEAPPSCPLPCRPVPCEVDGSSSRCGFRNCSSNFLNTVPGSSLVAFII